MGDDLLAEQAAYYRRRAGEYDATAYGDVGAARERIARIAGTWHVTGDVLEIACGTGLWTEALARTATSLLATDAAPEALAIARDRVTASNVTFGVADVFAWTAPRRFDVIFFSAWLSHVPSEQFAQFWHRLRSWLAEGGRVLFLDEHVDERAKESYVEDGVVARTLSDGTTFRIVKNFVDPAELVGRLAGIGWDCRVVRDGTDWVHGEARPLG